MKNKTTFETEIFFNGNWHKQRYVKLVEEATGVHFVAPVRKVPIIKLKK